MDSEKLVWTPKEVAARLGVSLVTLHNWRREGKGPHWIQPGGDGCAVFYPKQDFNEFCGKPETVKAFYDHARLKME